MPRSAARNLFRLIGGLSAVWLELGIGPRVGNAAPDPVIQQARQSALKGMEYLRKTQETDGSWSHYPATTALAVTGFLRNGCTETKEPAVARGIQFIVHSVKANGAVYSDADPKLALPTYTTALCLTALSLTHNLAYKSTIQKAQQYLQQQQFDAQRHVAVTDPDYGGLGYGGNPDRPDLSNLQMALEGLRDTHLAATAPLWKEALIFVQRAQNRKATNDQAWAKDGTNDGGFLYSAKGRSVSPETEGHPSSYGAMTYAGLKSYLYCGVPKNDPRVQDAWNWIRAHYTVTEHPGMGQQSLYYYYHTMAQTLDAYGQKAIKDNNGGTHLWAHDLAAQCVKLQRPDGSWLNDTPRFWEDRPQIVTGYVLIALSYCTKR